MIDFGPYVTTVGLRSDVCSNLSIEDYIVKAVSVPYNFLIALNNSDLLRRSGRKAEFFELGRRQMDDDNKCGNNACVCPVTGDTDYCSDHCREVGEQDIVEIACDCGHDVCS